MLARAEPWQGTPHTHIFPVLTQACIVSILRIVHVDLGLHER